MLKNHVSICIPTYNRGRFIFDAIHSAIHQNDDNFEVLIVDDGSTDNTSSIVNSIKSPKIKYIYKEHTNAPDTRNTCVKESSGEFILWLDSDDILSPDLICHFRSTLKDFPDLDICYGDIEPFGDLKNFKHKIIEYSDYYHKNNQLLSDMLYGNKIPNPGSFIRKSIFQKIGLYNTEFSRAHDYEFWTRCIHDAVFKHINVVSLRWRWHTSNMSTENTQYDTSFEAKIVKQLIQNNSIQSFFPDLDWSNKGLAELIARSEIGKIFLRWKDEDSFLTQIGLGLKALFPTLTLPKNSAEQCHIFSTCYEHIFEASKNFYFKTMSQIINNLHQTQNLRHLPPHSSSLVTKSEPLVSVVVPTYNRPEQLISALQSILAQTFSSYEIIVVNDSGIDVSKIINALGDPRITYISHTKNKGLAATRNTALRNANGKYIAYLDDDDEYYPEHLETLVKSLEKSHFKVAYCDSEKYLYENTNGLNTLRNKFVEHSVDFDPLRLLVQNYIPVLCLMHERSCLSHVGMFDESMAVHEDWDLWIRLSNKFAFKHIKSITSGYKIVVNSHKNLTTTRKIDFIKTMQYIYMKNRTTSSQIKNIQTMQKKCLKNLTSSITNTQDSSIVIGDNYEIFINNRQLHF